VGDTPGDETGSPVIRVYNEAGNVIETHQHAAILKTGKILLALGRTSRLTRNSHDSAFVG
jgi:hypothetical protein